GDRVQPRGSRDRRRGDSGYDDQGGDRLQHRAGIQAEARDLLPAPSGSGRTVDRPMENGFWTIAPCPAGKVRALVEALGVGPTTASVLVRRGHADPEEARAFLAGALPGHDPFLLGEMRGAVDTLAAAAAAGSRICVHGDYDADGICATAL